MQGRHILLVVLLAAAAVVGGCTAPEDTANTQSISPTPSPAPTEAQVVDAGLSAPTPAVPARESKMPQNVTFVDPRIYQIPTPTPTIAMTKMPDDLRVSGKLVDYAKTTVDYPPRVLATEVYHIPYPYWAVNVSATPMNDYPWLTMDIYQKDDPNRVVREIRYSRSDIAHPGNVSTNSSSTSSNTTSSNSTTSGSAQRGETFTVLEGYDDFYFVIRSESLKSLTVTIQVPEKYLV